uniref:Bm3355 n=1 Tax=Brugia malayi TaxID=6279 RepID=A0A0H5SBV5_BRUMA|nr:Bm3355 [Brugia malayi]
MRLLHRCEIAFGQKIQLSDCLSNLATLVAFEKQGIQQCPANLSFPQYIHNSGYDSACGRVERQINQFVMPMLQLLCLSGNILNLLIYRLPYFQGSTSVHFLKVKAYANLVFVESRVLENHNESFSQRRKCVIRMTVATTLSHLLLEGPALLTFAAVARKGANSSDHGNNICILAHGNNLLSVINAATPFFVFLAFNEQFRRMSLVFIQVHFVPRRFMKKTSVPPHKLHGISSSVKLINNASSFPSNYTHL